MSSSTDVGPSHFPGSTADTKRVSLPPPPPRLSPEFRNGDFLSRLLAATPPYLYNIPLVPQSFFFSDMLKSFVAGNKPPEPVPQPPQLEFPASLTTSDTVPSKELPGRPPHRRRKRTWREMNEPSRFLVDRKPPLPPPPPPPPPMDKPLELTNNNRSVTTNEETNIKHSRHDSSPSRMISPSVDRTSPNNNPIEASSPPTPLHPPNPLMLPNLPHCGMLPLPGTDFHPRLSTDQMSNELVPSLPPFPPHMWYPSLYPGLGPNMPPQPPYGIDPLHFFIDLRVSGHIWDRKPPFGTTGVHSSSPTGLDCTMDKERSSSNSSGSPHGEVSSSRLTELDNKSPVGCEERNSGPLNLVTPSSSCKPPFNLLLGNGSKHSKHTSAFSVPEPRPLMMTTKNLKKSEGRKKFPTINYVLQNLPRIYEDLQKHKTEDNEEETTSVKKEEKKEDESGEAPCKDLPALIGLELVVDYVKHETKPGAVRRVSSSCASPATSPAGDMAPPQLALSPAPEAERVAAASP